MGPETKEAAAELQSHAVAPDNTDVNYTQDAALGNVAGYGIAEARSYVARVLASERLAWSRKLVLLAIWSASHGARGYFEGGPRQVADACAISEKSALASLRDLEALGLIVRIPNGHAGVYLLHQTRYATPDVAGRHCGEEAGDE